MRVIQEKTFTRIGETQERTVDVRFISATNKSLEQEVMDGKFREDLFFRLNVIEIPMPPLREREGDLPLLAHHFSGKYSRELGKDIKKVSTYAMDILGIIERSIALETSNIVLPQSLTLSNFKKARVWEDRRRTDLGPDGIKIDEVMTEIERDYIAKAIEMTYGSHKKAAELLGITYQSLRHRLTKLKI